MTLVEGERTLIQDASSAITLTTHRVRFDGKQGGQRKLVSITLDSVASCGLVVKSYPALLLLAAVFAIGGFVVGRDGHSSDGNTIKLVAVAWAILFLATRSSALEIASAGESIAVSARGRARAQLVEFVNAVEAAKLAFLGVARR